jgi:hypothetical protein
MYSGIATLVFYQVARLMELLDSPWKEPGPFFASLVWPITGSFILFVPLAKRLVIREKKPKVDKILCPNCREEISDPPYR